jgi:hypothetical protein
MRSNVRLLLNFSYQCFGALMERPIHPLTVRKGMCSCECVYQLSTMSEQFDDLLADRARIRPEIEAVDTKDLVKPLIAKGQMSDIATK